VPGPASSVANLFDMFSLVAIALITVVLALVAVDTTTHGRLAKVSKS
jgi:hypothetical protein